MFGKKQQKVTISTRHEQETKQVETYRNDTGEQVPTRQAWKHALDQGDGGFWTYDELGQSYWHSGNSEDY